MEFLGTLLRGLWRVIQAIQTFVLTVFALILLIFFAAVIGMSGGPEIPSVPKDSALVVNPQGVIVEQLTARDPIEMILSDQESRPPETLLRDIVSAIRTAKDDDRISVMVLSLDGIAGAGVSQLHYIGSVIDEFKESGKPVIAYGGGFTQAQYLLAAHADEVYMHPFGGVLFTGYGIYPTYLKSALEKIKASVSVFRVGAYKTAAEPFLRDDLSDEARETFGGTLDVLWDAYVAEIAATRGISAEAFTASFETIEADLATTGGDLATLVLNKGLVDGLKTRQEWRDYMIEKVGEDGDGYKHIALEDYVTATNGAKATGGREIAVVVAKGAILDGEQKAGTIGGDTIARLIRKARKDKHTKAIVMRVDSGGGSAYASEIIRQEINTSKAAGIPVIVSMGSVAASGGYWISASADEIWAEPTTITGSIGILAIFMTFERSFDALGIHRDGVGTTPLSGAFDPLMPMSDTLKNVVSQMLNDGYQDFLERVAEGRKMAEEDVDAIGRGRIWSGQQAVGLGLVDNLGTVDDAIAAAAARAGLEEYGVSYIEDEPSAEQQFLEFFFGSADALGLGDFAGNRVSPLQRLIGQLRADLDRFAALNDPMGAYALCLECDIRQ